MEQIIDFVVDTDREGGDHRSSSPAQSRRGAFIQAIIAIYNTIMFFVERLQQIVQVVAGVHRLDRRPSPPATSAPRPTGSRQTMAGLLTLVISFLARFAGLGKVSDAVMKIINRIRAPIDKALDKVVEWIVAMAKRLGRFIAQAGVPQDPAQRLEAGLATGRGRQRAPRHECVGGADCAVLGAVKVRYGLKSPVPVEVGNDWWVEAEVNPKGRRKTDKKKEAGSAAVSPMLPQVKVDFNCNTKKYKLGEYQGQLTDSRPVSTRSRSTSGSSGERTTKTRVAPRLQRQRRRRHWRAEAHRALPPKGRNRPKSRGRWRGSPPSTSPTWSPAVSTRPRSSDRPSSTPRSDRSGVPVSSCSHGDSTLSRSRIGANSPSTQGSSPTPI